jgi:DNA-binding response OmpR family regulator
VALHQGTIQVESKVNRGTTFIVTLDENNFYSTVTYQCGNIDEQLELAEEHLDEEINSSITKENERKQETLISFDEHEGKPILLIVEDNEGIRNYITENFEDEYEVVQASNGKEGLALALDRIPDVIISDIMMPIMDGNELLRAVKKDVRTSHIPVLLLTAKDGDQSKIEGYDAGADSYITKPFTVSVLQSRVKNLLNQRRQLIAKIMNKTNNNTIQQKAQELRQAMSESDHAFFEQLNKILDKNITGDLDVNIVAKELGMSASTLYRKMKALTGASTNGYLRHYKMQYAERLLMQGKYTISEIAFMVGINSIAYFRKCFKEEFGCLPSEYLRKISAKD